MAGTLDGKTVAFLATEGVEQSELTEPWKAVEEAGGTPELISLQRGEVQAFEHLDKGDTFPVDRAVADADASRYDGLVLPGGVANPDFLRSDEAAVAFVRAFFEQAKPVAAICHGPWTLIEAGVVKGRTLTSWPSLRTDLRNAGATWVDEEVHVDEGLVTSRKPDDLPAFCAKLVEEIAEGAHEGQRTGAAA
jgi:protease I